MHIIKKFLEILQPVAKNIFKEMLVQTFFYKDLLIKYYLPKIMKKRDFIILKHNRTHLVYK